MNRMKTWSALVAAMIGAAVLAAQPAWSQGRDEHRDHRDDRRAPRFHGEIEHFHEHDWDMWRGGRWQHSVHDGRWGWWWVVGGLWYFYPEPVYPYPNPYEPPVAVVVPPTQAPQAAPPPAPAPQNWYYCGAPKGYYPYVPSCPGGWQVVPATPNQAPPPQ